MTSLRDLAPEQKVLVIQAGFGYTRNEAIAFLVEHGRGNLRVNSDDLNRLLEEVAGTS